MSVVVRPARADDVTGVVDFLYTHMSGKVPKERWRLLLDYPWRPVDADRGQIATDGERVVGFLGTVYADRRIGGRLVRFCNICAWYLLRDYRGRGVGEALRDQAVADPRRTYTLVTATAATDRAFRHVGFAVLDNERFCFSRGRRSNVGLEVIRSPEALEPHLPPHEREIFEDHRNAAVEHLLIRRGGHACYIVLQVKKKGLDVSYHEVMHASDRRFLGDHAQALADALLGEGPAVLAIDKRLIEPAPGAASEAIPQPRLFRSPDLAASDIDLLYNEIVLLDLKLP